MPLDLPRHILLLESEGKVTRTFRRLDPDRQEAVLQAILDEAAEHGPADLNIKQVAARAGVAVGSLYQYFGSRAVLLDFATSLCVRYLEEMFQQIGPWLAASPLREGLRRYLGAGLEWSQAQGAGLVRFLVRAAYHGDPSLRDDVVRPLGASMQSAVRQLLEGAAARGELRAGLDLEATARVVNLLTIAAFDSQLLPYLDDYYQLVDDAVPFDRILDAALDLVLQGIEARAEEERP
jgi:AcrR family transcriptional regulator